MVELCFDPLGLNLLFHSLSDPTRRDILHRVSKDKREMSIGEIAEPYDMSFAAVAKHLKILEKAKLIIKRRRGKEQVVQLAPAAFKEAALYLESYEKTWNQRLDKLERYLQTFPQ